MLKKRILLSLLVSFLFVIPITSSAQVAEQLEALEIAVWPEYDRPGKTLVIYQARLPETIDTPATLSLPIPASVGEPHAVAAWYPDGGLDDSVSWTTTRQGEWTWIDVTTVTNGVWLEFYDDIDVQGKNRTYGFEWPGGVATDSLIYDVMHPIGSTQFQINPAGEQIVGANSIPHTRIDLGPALEGEPYELAISYSKPSAFTGALPEPRPNPSLSQFQVSLWPEYDRLATLVIFRGGLSVDTVLPAVVSLPVPASVGDPNAVAFLGEDNRLYSTEFDREVEGEWAWITFETESLAFQVEYYADLEIEGGSRAFTYVWPGVLDIELFNFEVQQPVGATAFSATPAGTPQVAPDGLIYQRGGFGPQQLGTPLNLTFAYDKEGSGLSVDSVTTAPTIDRPTTTQGSTPELTALLPYILGGFGAALIVLGLWLYLRMRREESTGRKPSRVRRRKPKAERSSGGLDAAAVFCHVCGSKATASDHFCRNCGTKLRH